MVKDMKHEEGGKGGGQVGQGWAELGQCLKNGGISNDIFVDESFYAHCPFVVLGQKAFFDDVLGKIFFENVLGHFFSLNTFQAVLIM